MAQVAPQKCFNCSHFLPVGLRQCKNPKCREWNHNRPKATRQEMDDSTVLLDDAELSVIQRIETGLVDIVFGGGIVPTSVNLMGGAPGAGKTTLCLQLADFFCEKFPGKEVLYIANEQHATELKATAIRLELKYTNKIRVVKAMGGITHDIGDLLLAYRPCLTILDSVSKWAGEDLQLATKICQRLKDYTVNLNAPTIIVNQVVKSGDHAGLNNMQHAVDMTCMFDVIHDPSEPVTPETPRELFTEKNRFGPAPINQYFKMTGTGLVPITLDEED